MEVLTLSLTFRLENLTLTLKWTTSEQSEDMLIEAVDSLAKFFLALGQAKGIKFRVLDKQSSGEVVSIESLVLDGLTSVETVLLEPGKPLQKKEAELTLDVSGNLDYQGKKFTFSNLSLEPPPKTPEAVQNRLPRITLQELAQHKTPGNAWLAVQGKVYDVSKYHALHPGGGVILSMAGKDATEAFSNFQSDTAHPWVSVGTETHITRIGDLASSASLR